ncbi:hypothetical protein BKA93DRAFT_727392 [Sparassis latifolia]
MSALTAISINYTGQFCWYIPAEIRDRIIDTLHADRPALRACSLTCHGWLPRARYHLFRSVTFDPVHNSNVFKALIESSPIVANYVRDVEICGNGGMTTWWAGSTPSARMVRWPTLNHTPHPHRKSDAPDVVEWLDRTLPLAGTRLNRVISLRLSALAVSSIITQALVLRFKRVRVLSVDGCKALAFADFIELLQAFPQLEELHLLAAQWLPRITTVPHAEKDIFPRLKKLEVSRKMDIAPLITWMLGESVHAEITFLSCVISGGKSASAIRDLLCALGSTLEHLEIGFQETRDPTEIIQATQFDLTSCTGLRTLRMCCSDLQPCCSMYHPSLSWVVILLSKMESPQLQKIVLFILSKDLCALNLEGLDVVLSHARFGSVKSLTFDIEVGVEPHGFDIEVRLRNRMSALHTKGVLDFYFHPH